MPGIFQRLGGLADRAIRLAQQAGRTVGEFLRIVKPIAPEIEPMAAARDYGRVTTADAMTPEIIALRPDEYVPRDLYTVKDIPWSDPYAYEISVFGRDRATGRFRRQKFDMTMTAPDSINALEAEARHRFGGYEGTQFSEIWSVEVTGAWKSAEVEW